MDFQRWSKGMFLMRSLVIVAPLAVLLTAAPASAQGGRGQAPAGRGQTPAPTQGTGRGQAPAPTPPATPPPAAAAAVPPVGLPPTAPFPAGAKIGLVNLQQIAALSSDGKAATTKVQALIAKKQGEGQSKSKALTDNQNRLQQTGSIMTDAARSALQKEIERQTVEGQRFEQDAQAEVQELQNELQNEFQKKLFPILQTLAQEKGLHILLSAADAGAIWWEPGIDLTGEAIKRLDAATGAKQ
jgi:Skp family chaperone for outer membrane proteins